MAPATLGDDVGAAQPPPGVVADFENPPRDLTALYVVLGICLATSTLLVCVRLFTRVFVLKRRALEDCECVSALPIDRDKIERHGACTDGF